MSGEGFSRHQGTFFVAAHKIPGKLCETTSWIAGSAYLSHPPSGSTRGSRGTLQDHYFVVFGANESPASCGALSARSERQRIKAVELWG
jgi:hypothetical protein